ncbi:MAG TPA: protein kinase [Planktothrix sp.]
MNLEQKERDPNFDADRTWTVGMVRRCLQCGMLYPMTQETCTIDGSELDSGVPAAFPLKDKYKFIAELGSGGFGAVYKAYNPMLSKRVAIKVLHPHMANDKMLRRFQNEARVMSALDNPHIVKVLDFGISDFGQPYMVMDFVDGESLEAVLKWRGTLSVDESIPIILQICAGIAAAHDKGICHRDLKPSNIIYKPDCPMDLSVRVIDFGIAKLLEGETSEVDRLTTTGEVFGSPAYMSPEQARGVVSDQRSDIYSLGCVIYEMLTGCPPIMGKSSVETIMKQMTEEAPPLSAGSLKETFSLRLEEIVARCLEKDPEKRYQTMHALAQDLRTFQNLPLAEVAAPAKSQKKSQSQWRSNLLFMMIGAFSMLLAAMAGFAIWSYIVANKEANQTKLASAELQDNIDSFNDVMKGALDKRTTDNEATVDRRRETIDLSKQRAVDDAFVIANVTAWSKIPIRHIDLSKTRVGDEGLLALTKLDQLESLNLEQTKITKTGLPALLQLHKLKTLRIGKNSLEPRDFKIIGQVHSLKTLEIFEENVGDQGLSYLRDLKHLEILRAGNTHIDDLGLTALNNMPLCELRIGRNKITDSGLKYLHDVPLDSLSLDGDTGVTDDGIDYLRKIETLKVVDISGTRISQNGRKLLISSDIQVSKD